jgi:protein-tyrosine phosphatase
MLQRMGQETAGSANEPFSLSGVAVPGGGTILIAPMPGRGGRLAEDVALIAEARPVCVVSMTEQGEMREAGAGAVPDLLAARGIRWSHFPVRDFGVPDAADARWPPLAAALHAALDRGGTVFLHCMGGKGRSGMVAARLLVEREVDPKAAIAAVRAARPGAIETAAQEAWVRAGR